MAIFGEAAADVSGAGFLIVDGTTLEKQMKPLRFGRSGRHVVVSGLPDSRLLDEPCTCVRV